ncbi:ATP-binding protein [Pelagicoccus sp. SDUM812003]|uniref:ATP-binding protein n=1 Tax=Pelagicoccus sp. SDUM812003 TaxID=3041267 RepID=UPI0028109713|nr:ATP-binding protein [Pelagicoccus sp. SDUM812003]MDQ8205635.1 ATP-binding protein [Pelagicoccus sp. SDUM812003]
MRSLRFLDREGELEKLRSFASLEVPSLAILYGRRRCGKSRLLQEFSREQDLYFLADKQDPTLQRERLARDVALRFDGFDQVQYPSWESILTQVDGRMSQGSCLILDEFPYLAATSPELPSVIQRLLDTRRLKNTHLILCGSSQRMMLNLAMGAAEPLYGRSQLFMKIRPLECGWITKALSFDANDSITAYATLGGTPRYWELARSYDSIESFTKALILDRDGILHDEMRRLLLDDLNDSSLAISLLSLIGNGSHRISELAARIGKPATQLTRPIANLVELGYVRRETPFGENEKKSKRGLYKLSDPYLAFIYKFVEPNRSRLEMGDTNTVFDDITPSLSQHVSLVWEDLARRSVSRLNTANMVWQPAKRWWKGSNDREIDIVSESADKRCVLVGEAKWSNSIDPIRTLYRLQEVAEQLPIRKGQELRFALWSKAKAGKKGDLHLISPTTVLNALT